ncbi:MAG: glycosyltransferase [Chlorobi bacterium]|nr:glycosyltransferase [Chlorobiota bacterium]
MPDNGNRLLAVLTRNPVAGRVKSRLAATLGPETALQVYRTLREYTAGVMKACHAEKAVFYSEDIPAGDCFIGDGTLAFLQEGGDFGARMHHVFTTGFARGFRLVVLIGSDCPDIDSGIIENAFTALENRDAVLGPAWDGGFYLIGLKHARPELFTDRTWSHERVLRETIDILDKTGASYFLLPGLQDIDTIEDLKQSRLWPIKA